MFTRWRILCLLFTCVRASEVQYIIKEDQPPTFVGNVKESYNLKPNVSSDVYNNLIYKILGTGNAFAAYFRIENTTGLLFTKSSIDRDSLAHCSASASCILTIDVGIQSPIGAFFIKISVDVIIEDVNDNDPIFAKDTETVEFSEGSIKGTYATIDGASDKDVGNYSVQNYYIKTQNVPFDVEMETNADGSSAIKIVVDGELDRETLEYYQITVVAEDGGVPPKTAELTVDVIILDANDNKPVFNKTYYNVTVNEDIDVNTVIVNVSATDDDKGQNGEVVYRLSPNQKQEYIQETFSIDNRTGHLSVVKHLVYVPNVQTIIYVEAEDMGRQPKTSQVSVYVNIIDSKNHPPEINVNILSGDVEAAVSEYANVGAVVAHVGVKDADTERNGKVDCTGDMEDFKLERLAVKEYKVVVLGSLNREMKDKYLIVINCHDNGSPPMYSSANFTVKIIDENDNPPRFDQGTYFLKAEENNAIGDVVGEVKATDIDIGRNAKLTYTLKNSSGYNFWLDSISGELRANFVLDRENVSQFLLTIAVTDDGSPPLSGSASVVLTVLDQNDNYPVFSPPNYEIFVYEEIPYNTTIEQVSARDNDYGVNGTIFFSFGQPPSSNFPFMLFTDGTIKATRRLDREMQARYEFTVIASDLGSPPLSSSVTVTVVLLDLNDNEPYFVFPDKYNNTVTVPLSIEINSVITTIKAIDRDEKANKDLTYSIVNGSASNMFSIETKDNLGNLRILRLPDSSESMTYTIQINALDHGTPNKSAMQNLTIKFIEDTSAVDSRNFAIAISLGCVTVVLSIVIVLSIFLIRRHDQNRKRDCIDCSKSDLEVTPDDLKPNLIRTSESDSIDSLKKVSFSMDNTSTLSTDRSKDTSSTPLVDQNGFKISENGRIPGPSYLSSRNAVPPFLNGPNVQEIDHISYPQHRTHVQSHDHIWPSQNTVPTTPITKDQVPGPEDNGSESSAETATWDSGNGGSVSDVQSPLGLSYDNDHIKMVTFADKPTHHYIESHYKPPTSNKVHNQLSLPKLSNCDNNSTSPRGHYSTDSSANNRTVPGLRQGQKLSPIQDSPGVGFVNSYDEDDDTTTEGSYTIDPDDWAHSPGVDCSRPYFAAKEAYC